MEAEIDNIKILSVSEVDSLKPVVLEESVLDAQEVKENFQVKGISYFHLLLDKLTQKLFNKDFSKIEIDEKIKAEEIISTVAKTLPINLNEFDKAVFCAALSWQIEGNAVVTLESLAKTLGSAINHKVSDKFKKDIFDSIRRLMGLVIDLDITGIVNHYGSNLPANLTGSILPSVAAYNVSVNGYPKNAVIKFLDYSPLYRVALMKNQLTKVNSSLISAPSVKTSKRTVTLKMYLLERIKQKKLKETILLSTLYKNCGMENLNRFEKRDTRNEIAKILDFYVSEGLIKSWQFVKEKGEFAKIIFSRS